MTNIKTDLNIIESLATCDGAYLILKTKDGDYIHSEVQISSYYANSDNDESYQTDFGYEFKTAKAVQDYFCSKYDEVYVYTESSEYEEAWDIMDLGSW